MIHWFIYRNHYSLSDIRKSGLVNHWTRYYFLKTFGRINNIENFDESINSEDLILGQLLYAFKIELFGICISILLLICEYIYNDSEFKPFDSFTPEMSFSIEKEEQNSRKLSIDSDINMDLLNILTTNWNKNVWIRIYWHYFITQCKIIYLNKFFVTPLVNKFMN